MLHAKFQDNRTSGSGEKNEGFLIRYGQGGHPRPVTWTIDINFLYHCQRRFHMKFGFDKPSDLRK